MAKSRTLRLLSLSLCVTNILCEPDIPPAGALANFAIPPHYSTKNIKWLQFFLLAVKVYSGPQYFLISWQTEPCSSLYSSGSCLCPRGPGPGSRGRGRRQLRLRRAHRHLRRALQRVRRTLGRGSGGIRRDLGGIRGPVRRLRGSLRQLRYTAKPS